MATKTAKKKEVKKPTTAPIEQNAIDPDTIRTGGTGVSLNFRVPKDVDRLLFALQIDRRDDPKNPIRSRSQACLVAIIHGLRALGYISVEDAERVILADRQIKTVDRTSVV
jgi:hypothetical protein